MDGRRERQMDRQADESDFIVHCPTDVEHPKSKTLT